MKEPEQEGEAVADFERLKMRAVDHTTNDRQAKIAVVLIDTSEIRQNNSNNKLSKRGITSILTKRCFQHSRACLEVCGSDKLG